MTRQLMMLGMRAWAAASCLGYAGLAGLMPSVAAAQDGSAAVPTLAEGEKPKAEQPKTEESKAARGRAGLPASETTWSKLATEAYRGKQDDIFFITPTTGWYVNGAGKIFKTTDSGATWVKQLEKPGTYFRCVVFLDEQRGFAGNIGPGYFPNVTDDQPLYATIDGGATWTAVTSIEGAPVVGLCALEVVREPFVNAGNLAYRQRIVGVGRVGGPSAFIYSDDDGKTWKQLPMPAQAAMAFDVHFFDFNRGLIASASDANVEVANATALATDDAGKTWREVYRSKRPFEIAWKMSFPSRDTGYLTVQSYNPDPKAAARFVAKTTDGGRTWSEIPLVEDAGVRQFGVAFVSDLHGWVGAMPGGFETLDGGATWRRAEFGNAVNKIRVLREKGRVILHAVGVNVHRLELAEEAAK